MEGEWTVEEMMLILSDVERRMGNEESFDGLAALEAFCNFADDIQSDFEAA